MSPLFAQYLRAFCDKHKLLLIMDEIQSGFGRTGMPFVFEHLGIWAFGHLGIWVFGYLGIWVFGYLGIEPDMVLLGKSVAGGLPLGAVIGRADIMNDLPKGSLGSTYSENPVACAAANATLNLFQSSEVWATAKAYQQILEKTIKQWQRDCISPWLYGLKGIGTMRGIELRQTTHGTHTNVMEQVLTHARKLGLLLMPSGRFRHIIRLLPLLTIEPTTLIEGLDILKVSLSELPDNIPLIQHRRAYN